MNLIIDQEFQDLIPIIEPSDLKELEQSLIKDGCLDTLKVWGGIIVDGHNRYEICTRRGIDFKITDMQFADRDEAKVWILRNQLARRNLLDYQRGVVAIKLEAILKPKAKERQDAGLKTSTRRMGDAVKKVSSTLTEPINTRKEVAKAAGLSEGTIRKVKVIEEKATPEQKEAILDRRASINKVYNEIVPPKAKAVDERLECIKEAFEGITLEEIRARQDKAECPCCGRPLGAK